MGCGKDWLDRALSAQQSTTKKRIFIDLSRVLSFALTFYG